MGDFSTNSPKVTIFGGTGFLGRYIVQRLARIGGHQLVALGIDPLDHARLIPKELQSEFKEITQRF